MKYTKKPPETDHALSEKLRNAGWKKIREPKNIAAAMLCSVPFVFILGGLSILLIDCLDPSLFSFLQNGSFTIEIRLNLSAILYILGILIFLLLHELLHAVFIPGFLRSEKTFWGIHILFGFVFTTEPIKKGRYIVISIMPFILLSVLLPSFLRLCGLLTAYAAFLCFINAIGSCVDFLNVCLIGFQVPKGRTIISNGFETYYGYIGKPKS